MVITSIKQQAKRADRYSIFVDGKYSFSLSEDELVARGLHSGQELSPQEVKGYKKLSEVDKIYNLALNLIARRPRSRKELQDYLKRKKLDEQESNSIIARLENNGLLNDQDFAKRWVENRRELKNASTRKLRLELRAKGISSEIIDEVLEDSHTAELTALQELISKKRRQTKYQDDLKLMQFLARQGFSYGDIKDALNS